MADLFASKKRGANFAGGTKYTTVMRLLLNTMAEREVMVAPGHLDHLSPLAPPSADESLLSPHRISERAWVVTAVLAEILSRDRAIPHGGIND